MAKNRVILVLYTLLLVMAFFPGCQCIQQMSKGWESQTTGLYRTITVYDYTGKQLGQWKARTVIDADSGGLTTFFDEKGNRVLVNGGILIAIEYKP